MLKPSYGVIYADPPWSFATYSRKGKGRSAEAYYDCMSLAEIKDFPAGRYAASDCVLFLWATNPMLPQALNVVEAWGFTYKTVAFTWAKRTPTNQDWHLGLGYWTRQNTESCLLATRGHPGRKSRSVRQLVVSPRREHSRKPDEVYSGIEALCEGPYLELFARYSRPGWDAVGDEAGAGAAARRWVSSSYPED